MTDFQPTWVKGLSLWLKSDAGITLAYNVAASGTAPPAVTITGQPTLLRNALSVEIDITLTGIRGTATFTWKYGGVTQQTGQLTAATFALGTTGLTANFPAGTYTNDNVYTASPTVSTWSDQSGNNINPTQATAANQPLYVATGTHFKSISELSFSGSQWLIAPTVNLAQPLTQICVVNFNGNYAQTPLAISTNGPNVCEIGANTSGFPIMYGGGSILAGAASMLSASHVLCGQFNGGSSALFVDNSQTAVVSGNAGGNSWDMVQIAGLTGANNNVNGFMTEVLCYSKILTSQELRRVFNYLGPKNGIIIT